MLPYTEQLNVFKFRYKYTHTHLKAPFVFILTFSVAIVAEVFRFSIYRFTSRVVFHKLARGKSLPD